jgi:phosphoenolpyruvate carboxykinase (GTP)
MGTGRKRLPKIFHVNWFRKDASGKFLWPGFGENLRVLRWIVERSTDSAANRGNARGTPIGVLPAPGAIDTEGLDLPSARLDELLRLSRDEWLQELREEEEFLRSLGERVPDALWREYRATLERFG